MKRRRILLVSAVAVVLAGVALGWLRGPEEPVYKGRPLSEWLDEARIFNGSSNQSMAEKIIRAAGTNALPWLMSEFTRPHSKWKESLNRQLAGNTRWGFRFDDNSSRIARAGGGLQLLGPAIIPALPELEQWLGDPRRGTLAAQAMTGAWSLALPYFVNRLNGTNASGQVAAIFGLGVLAREMPTAVPPLLQAFQSTNHTVRLFTVVHLHRVRFHPELTIPALTAALSDSDPRIKKLAASSLDFMLLYSAPLVTELRRQMQDTNLAVVLTASNALHLLEFPPQWVRGAGRP